MNLFLTSSANEVMTDVVRHLPLKPSEYNVAFINTAAEPEPGDHWWVSADKKSLTDLGFNVDEFTITGLNSSQIEEKLLDKNLIFVAGGNTFYLLDQTIKNGFDQILKRKISEGIVYIGSSAGSMIVGKRIDLVCTIDDKSKAPNLKSDGLGIVDLALLPHWGSPDFKKEYGDGFSDMYCENVKIIPLSNKQYLWVNGINLQLVQI
ncbi:MAG: Type 1 glutamine amidotransferase-like domain-containing protein [Candidatus Shapirobacteria bacterium]|nr:Type 1 glutamine amidotransferase-like domain-containing protein [Candidatus Shapirobacteria bacterium]